ncbi:sensor histidine kinase, partial [Streptomyces sp. SID8455]|nr:sensor histidine kinase [Streptomyces sp. SID8455]
VFGKDNFGRERFERPWVAFAYLAFLLVWTLATLPKVRSAAACTKRFLGADLVVALTGIMLTPLADIHSQTFDGPTLPSI